MFQKLKYLKNENLKSIKPGFKGVPYKRGRFAGEYEARSKKITTKSKSIVRFIERTIKKEKNIEETLLPVIEDKGFLEKKEDFIVWLGHATFLMQISGIRIITDPCFSSIPFKKRLMPAPLHIKELGSIDYMLISHGHHDHLDIKTIRYAGNQIKEALVPLKMGRLIKRANRHIKVQEAGWYQQYNTKKEVEIYFLPAHHWHRRNPFDYNKVLWGSFVIRNSDKTIFFAGDSGYNKHFKEIAEIFGKIDYAIMPINPPYVMEGSHMTHSETIKAIKDLNPDYIIPMHYGAFKLTVESVDELIQWFKNLKNHPGIHAETLMPAIGEVIEI
ncbi:MBL fold metallo-hydrolase [Nitrosophilus alvini]|uniref:MBL fold metallo-hydrolase n=1 Tax=Nitrosophilus alvini TaxID=2714855 RepID=UPI00190BF720|nr:MBL fold metallo-hydrolase [Nitrosophilus alvini]